MPPMNSYCDSMICLPEEKKKQKIIIIIREATELQIGFRVRCPLEWFEDASSMGTAE